MRWLGSRSIGAGGGKEPAGVRVQGAREQRGPRHQEQLQ